MITLLLFLAAAAPAQRNLGSQMAEIARAAGGHVGAAAMLLETRESASFHGTERFPMQSVYKLPIGMAVLHEVDRGTLTLDRQVWIETRDQVPDSLHSPIRDAHRGVRVSMSVRELLRFMVAESDGTACDILLRLAGGADHVTAYLRGLGVSGMVVATTEAEMARNELVQYRNWATPVQVVRLLQVLQAGAGLSAPSHALLMQWMSETSRGGNRLKGLLPVSAKLAHKPGTSNTVNGLTRATNDVGLITLADGRHLAVAVFVADSTAGEAVREGVIAKTARAAWDYWSVPK